eukprot:4159939-Heterocapsa_arctica.AAC.1
MDWNKNAYAHECTGKASQLWRYSAGGQLSVARSASWVFRAVRHHHVLLERPGKASCLEELRRVV